MKTNQFTGGILVIIGLIMCSADGEGLSLSLAVGVAGLATIGVGIITYNWRKP